MSEKTNLKDGDIADEEVRLDIFNEETKVSEEEILAATTESDEETEPVSEKKDDALEEEKEEVDVQESEEEQEESVEEEEIPTKVEEKPAEESDDMLSADSIPEDWEWEDYSKNYHRLPPSVKKMYKKMTSETGKKFEEAATLRKEAANVLESLKEERKHRESFESEKQKRDEESRTQSELENMTEEERSFYLLNKKVDGVVQENQQLKEKLQQKDYNDMNLRLDADIEKVIQKEIPEEYRDKVRKKLKPELIYRWNTSGAKNEPIEPIDVIAKDVLAELKPSADEIKKLVLESNLPEFAELRKQLLKQGAEKVVSKKKTKQIPATGKSSVAPTKKEVIPDFNNLEDIEGWIDNDPEYQRQIKELEQVALNEI